MRQLTRLKGTSIAFRSYSNLHLILFVCVCRKLKLKLNKCQTSRKTCHTLELWLTLLCPPASSDQATYIVKIYITIPTCVCVCLCVCLMKGLSAFGCGHSSALSEIKRTDSDSMLPTCVTLQSGRHKDLLSSSSSSFSSWALVKLGLGKNLHFLKTLRTLKPAAAAMALPTWAVGRGRRCLPS